MDTHCANLNVIPQVKIMLCLLTFPKKTAFTPGYKYILPKMKMRVILEGLPSGKTSK